MALNIYLCGVGGQGIGLLASVLVRAIDHAGIPVQSVDTHGLAQRGGTVVSHVRMGEGIHSPLIPENQAHVLLALEIHEAIRAVDRFGAPSATLFSYRTRWQPLSTRLGKEIPIDWEDAQKACAKRGIRAVEVFQPNLPDPRMQNIALLASLCASGLLIGVQEIHFLQAMEDLLTGRSLEENQRLFQQLVESEPKN